MEDNIVSLIIVVGSIAAGIVSAVKKNRHHSPTPKHMKEAWEELMGQTQEEEKPQYRPILSTTVAPEKSKYRDKASDANKKKLRGEFDYAEGSDKARRALDGMAKKNDENIYSTDNIEHTDDVIENFDLRAAVIYSEIMQPKFKQM